MISLTPHPISNPKALANVSEAASPSASAGSPPPTRTMTFPTWSQPRTAARRWLHALSSWLKDWKTDAGYQTAEQCPECERPCRNVTSLETSQTCAGRREIADCTICVRPVEMARGGGCPNGNSHLLANRKDKPYLTLVKGDLNTGP